MKPLPCFSCGNEFEPSLPGDIGPRNQPYGGTTFRASGQYGSTVFDPNVWDDASGFLELNICDRCLLSFKERLLHGHERRGPVFYDYEEWEPSQTLEQWEAWQERRRKKQAVVSQLEEEPASKPGQSGFESQ